MKRFFSVLTVALLLCGLVGCGAAVDDTEAVTIPMISAHTTHSLALKSDGSVWAWGTNFCGRLGNNSQTDSFSPVYVLGTTGVIIAVAAGWQFSLALKNDGTVWAWGDNRDRQLCDDTITNSTVAIQIQGLSGITAIAAGRAYALALKSDGTVWRWGELYYGNQCGIPEQVEGLDDVTTIAAGENHALAVKKDGTVWAWGLNVGGQLGDGTTEDRDMPVRVQGDLDNVIAVASQESYSLALRNDGTVWAWGRSENDILGEKSTVPVQVQNMNDVTAIAVGYKHALALKSDGTIWAWGRNGDGELGDGSTTSKLIPVQVKGLSNATAIAGGFYYSLALKSDGTVWAWGHNSKGELGYGIKNDSRTPARVIGYEGKGYLNLRK